MEPDALREDVPHDAHPKDDAVMYPPMGVEFMQCPCIQTQTGYAGDHFVARWHAVLSRLFGRRAWA